MVSQRAIIRASNLIFSVLTVATMISSPATASGTVVCTRQYTSLEGFGRTPDDIVSFTVVGNGSDLSVTALMESGGSEEYHCSWKSNDNSGELVECSKYENQSWQEKLGKLPVEIRNYRFHTIRKCMIKPPAKLQGNGEDGAVSNCSQLRIHWLEIEGTDERTAPTVEAISWKSSYTCNLLFPRAEN